jgi:hypothetical protein
MEDVVVDPVRVGAGELVHRGAHLRAWRFVTLLLTALALSLPFAHLLEMPAKRGFGPDLYRVINQNLYWGFGTFGAAIEVAAVLACLALAFVVRGRRPAFPLALTAAVLMVAAHLVFWIFIAPVNAEIAAWAPGAMPTEWTDLRDRWEFSHAARAVLMIVGFGFLLASVLSETPARSADAFVRVEDDATGARIALRQRGLTG